MNSSYLRQVLKYPLIAVTLVAIAACVTLTKKKVGVEFGKSYVIVRPEAKVPLNELKALNATLKKYDKSLYKIQSFQNGRLIRTYGAMDEKFMRAGLSVEVAKQAALTDFTGCSLVAGTSSTRPGPSGPTRPPPPPVKPVLEWNEQPEEMVKQLAPTLERFNNQ